MAEYYPYGFDHVGTLGTTLRNLHGYTTLAHELIQNADDARATTMTFDVRDEALVVTNNSVFTNCGMLKERECPWKSVKGNRCDFHRFRIVAGGDKRFQESTTGTFGIGFISVYQITDQPEVCSGNQHWIIRPIEEEEKKRIQGETLDPPYNGTCFILRWADPASEFRQHLNLETLEVDQLKTDLREILSRTLPAAILFLKNLTAIELKRNGELIKSVTRISDGDQMLVHDGNQAQLWHILRGSFEAEAASLRIQHVQIEDKRTANITLALPDQPTFDGLFCACLPTEQPTELPFHINADFYPYPDRKRILLTDDYQGAWNRAAIRNAAELLANSLPMLLTYLDHSTLWSLFNNLHELHSKAEKGQRDQTFRAFWSKALPRIQDAATVYTSIGDWKQPANTMLLKDEDEEDCLSILEQVGLTIVHPDLRSFFRLLRTVGVPFLGLSDLAQALKRAGLHQPLPLASAPAWMQLTESRELLSQEIAILRKSLTREEQKNALQSIGTCAIALAHDGYLRPPANLYRVNPDLLPTLSALGFDNKLANQNPPGIADLIPELDVSAALRLLETIPVKQFERLWQEQQDRHFALIGWLAQNNKEIGRNKLKARVAALPIWPSNKTLHPLTKLYAAGSFDDPLHLASILNRQVRKKWRDFLMELDRKQLNIETYTTDLLPQAFASGQVSVSTQRRKLVAMLAKEIGQMRDNNEIRNALIRLPLIECRDDQFRSAATVYFDDVIATGFTDLPIAVIPKDQPEAIKELYKWLGVASEPRLSEVVTRIEQITAPRTPPTPESRKTIAQLFQHLGDRKLKANDPVLSKLRTLRWLPSTKDNSRWYAPNELYTVFNNYLFESQANFLAFERAIQTKASDLMDHLGIATNPPVRLVVDHVLAYASRPVPIKVNKQVYFFLNNNSSDPNILRLRTNPTLLLNEDHYVAPDRAFRSDHPFGRFRHRLPSELLAYTKLLDQLGVTTTPQPDDAISVIKDIAAAFADTPLDDEAYNVLMICWHLLDEAIQASKLDSLPELAGIPCIPTEDRYLRPPTEMFFADRPGLAERFGDFKDQHTITRTSGIWRAMTAAGIKPLSKKAKAHLTTHSDTTHAFELQEHILARSTLLARVIEAQLAHDQSWNKDLFNRLHVAHVSQLELVYTIKIPSQKPQTSDPTSEIAYFDQSNSILYVQTQSTHPWRRIARELAYALLPEDESSLLASPFHDVLSASTLEDAVVALNELGIAQLDPADFLSPNLAPMDDTKLRDEHDADDGEIEEDADYGEDGEADEQQEDEEEDEEDISHRTAPTRPTSQHTPSGTAQNPSSNGTSSGSSYNSHSPANGTSSGSSYNGHSSASGTSNGSSYNGHPPASGTLNGKTPSNNLGTSSGASSRPAPGKTTPDSPKREAGRRLLTYVSPARDPQEPSDSDPSDHAAHSAVDQAGIKRVLQFEKDAGRKPTEMSHTNPGYDIESCDKAGDIVRYIEVKSISGYWNATGVGLSKEQFSRANVYEEQFWLYIVERAEHDDARIYCIQDPARLVDKFFYDHGWKAIAESETTIPEEHAQ